jgi:hypothetical protein
MKASVRYALVFAGATLAGVYLHEIGHAAAGWMQGIAVVPSPTKEYILRPQVYWNQEIWIALGGVVGTTLAAVGATLYFLRVRSPVAEAVLFGALIPPWAYTIRFLLQGRGHDDTEWQAAQTALGLMPAGHGIDVFFLSLSLAGILIWGFRMRVPLGYSLLKLVGLAIGGTILLVALQVANNKLFDRVFPANQVVGAPSGLDPR